LEVRNSRRQAHDRRLEERRDILCETWPSAIDEANFVVAENYAVSDALMKGDSAEVIVDILPQGEIDSELRFTPSADQKGGLLFHLIPTSKQQSPSASGEAPAERTGPSEWRIVGTGAINWLEPAAAVRYVTDMKTRSTDPTIKKNADRALLELAKLH
jgi:hypothetical protein